MGLWTDIVGSVRGYIRLGLTGVRLKNSSGALAVRNAGDSAYAKVECDSIELGHASDTTLARVSAGVVAVEGVNLVKAGAATASGLTLATARLLGRTTAATGAVEEISIGARLALAAGSLDAVGLLSKSVTFTRDMTTATGTQAVTGVGFQPTAIIFVGAISGTAQEFVGFADSSKAGRNRNYLTSSGWFVGAQAISCSVSSGNYQVGDVSTYDADGFTISWIKSGAPTGTLTVYALCFR